MAGEGAMKPTFDCPRRAELILWGGSNARWADLIESSLDPDAHPVLDDDGKVIPPKDHWREDGTCSYCGSMSPGALFEAIACGAEIGPTDKNYKVYIRGGHRIVRGGALAEFSGKFYTVHLNRENAARLRQLIIDGKVTIGYPGHFYNGLWLASPADPEPDGAA